MTEAHDAFVPPFEAAFGPAIVLERLAQPIDATDLATARQHGAFVGLAKALAELTPDKLLDEVDTSQLRGRGGAGFATSQKWRFAAANARTTGEAYVVCNADEGDPGSYIDKYLMERDPFAIIEGLALCRLVDRRAARVHLHPERIPRAPHRRCVAPSRRLAPRGFSERRPRQRLLLRRRGRRGRRLVRMRRGDGAPAIARGTPRDGDGAAAVPGGQGPLRVSPTVVNNVETLANLGWIVRHGGRGLRGDRRRQEPRDEGRVDQRALRPARRLRGAARHDAPGGPRSGSAAA